MRTKKLECFTKHPVIWVLLFCAIFYWPIVGYGFLNYDDDAFLTANPMVNQGITADAVEWAFTGDTSGQHVSKGVQNLWHPVTWLCYMLEVELFGVSASMSHAIGLLLHLITGGLLYVLLNRLIPVRYTWRNHVVFWSVCIFLFHPQHAETVVWVAERKGQLAAVFGLAAIYFYLQDPTNRGYRALAFLAYILSIFSKPTMIVLPCLILFIQCAQWQGERLISKYSLQLIKQHLLQFWHWWVSAGILIMLTIRAQLAGTKSAETTGELALHGEEMLAKLGQYLCQALYPRNLSFLYPEPKSYLFLAAVPVIVSLLASGLIYKRCKAEHRRLCFLGIAWFVLFLIPVLGVIHVSNSFTNDRYTYLAHIGLFLSLLFILFNVFGKKASIVSGLFTLLLIVLNHTQLSRWSNPELFYESAIQAQPRVSQPYVNLAVIKLQRREYQASEELLIQAIEVNSFDHLAYYHLGNSRLRQRRYSEAIHLFHEALAIHPEFHLAMARLSICYASHSNINRAPDKALAFILKALQIGGSNKDYRVIRDQLIRESQRSSNPHALKGLTPQNR